MLENSEEAASTAFQREKLVNVVGGSALTLFFTASTAANAIVRFPLGTALAGAAAASIAIITERAWQEYREAAVPQHQPVPVESPDIVRLEPVLNLE